MALISAGYHARQACDVELVLTMSSQTDQQNTADRTRASRSSGGIEVSYDPGVEVARSIWNQHSSQGEDTFEDSRVW